MTEIAFGICMLYVSVTAWLNWLNLLMELWTTELKLAGL